MCGGRERLSQTFLGYLCAQQARDRSGDRCPWPFFQCANPLLELTTQEDCCGSVGAFWGVTLCAPCPHQNTLLHQIAFPAPFTKGRGMWIVSLRANIAQNRHCCFPLRGELSLNHLPPSPSWPGAIRPEREWVTGDSGAGTGYRQLHWRLFVPEVP